MAARVFCNAQPFVFRRAFCKGDASELREHLRFAINRKGAVISVRHPMRRDMETRVYS